MAKSKISQPKISQPAEELHDADAAAQERVAAYVSSSMARQPDTDNAFGITVMGITLTRTPGGNVMMDIGGQPDNCNMLDSPRDLAEIAGLFLGASRFMRLYQVNDLSILKWQFETGGVAPSSI